MGQLKGGCPTGIAIELGHLEHAGGPNLAESQLATLQNGSNDS